MSVPSPIADDPPVLSLAALHEFTLSRLHRVSNFQIELFAQHQETSRSLFHFSGAFPHLSLSCDAFTYFGTLQNAYFLRKSPNTTITCKPCTKMRHNKTTAEVFMCSLSKLRDGPALTASYMQTTPFVPYEQEMVLPSLEDPGLSPPPILSVSGQANLWQTLLGALTGGARFFEAAGGPAFWGGAIRPAVGLACIPKSCANVILSERR